MYDTPEVYDLNLPNITCRVIDMLYPDALNFIRRLILNTSSKTNIRILPDLKSRDDIENFRKILKCMVQNYSQMLKLAHEDMIRGLKPHILYKFEMMIFDMNYNGPAIVEILKNLITKQAFPKSLAFISEIINDEYVQNNIKFLNLSSMKLNKIPQEVFRLKSLEVLVLDNNNINSISHDDFIKLTQLKEISISENKLEHINQIFDGLLNLEKIHLRNNEIRFFETKTNTIS